MRRITPRAAAITALLAGTVLVGGATVAHAAGSSTSTPAPTSSSSSTNPDPLTPGDTADNPADPQGGQHQAVNEPDDATEAQSGTETAEAPESGQAGVDNQSDGETNDAPPAVAPGSPSTTTPGSPSTTVPGAPATP